MASRVISAVLKFKDQNFGNGLRQANRQAGDFGRAVNTAQNKVENMAKSVKSGFKMVGTAAAAIGTGAVAGLAASVAQSVLEMEDAFSKLQAQTGATGDDLANLKDAAKDTFSKGYGESLSEVSDAVARVKQNMQGLSGDEITDVTSNALLLAKTFDSDVNEVTRAANNLMTNFGMSSEKAFDMMTKGGQNGLNFSNEMFDNLSEYTPLWADMGYSAEEMFGILQAGAKEGVYNLDYMNDVMKEFQIRATDGSKTTSDALAELSPAARDVWKEFSNGEATVAEMSKAAIADLSKIDDKVKQNEIGVALFGTKWEDLGGDVVLSMLAANQSMDDFEGAADAAAQAVEGSFGNRVKSAFRDVTLSIAELADSKEGKELLDDIATAAEKMVPAIVDVAKKAIDFANVIKDNWGPIKETVIGITTAVVAFKVGMAGMSVITTATKIFVAWRNAVAVGTGVMGIFNGVLAANPIGATVLAIAGLVAIGVVLYRNWDTVTAKTKEVWASIGGLEGALRIVTGPIGVVIGAAKDLATNWDSTKSVWENVWGAMARSAADTVNAVIGGINKMIETINAIPGVDIPLVAKVDWGSVDQSKVSGAGFREVEGNYAVGSNRITHDQVANIHQDEMIIPARQAAKVRAMGGNINNIDKLISGQGKAVSTPSTNASTNKDAQFGDINIYANGVSKEEVVAYIVPQLKTALKMV